MTSDKKCFSASELGTHTDAPRPAAPGAGSRSRTRQHACRYRRCCSAAASVAAAPWPFALPSRFVTPSPNSPGMQARAVRSLGAGTDSRSTRPHGNTHRRIPRLAPRRTGRRARWRHLLCLWPGACKPSSGAFGVHSEVDVSQRHAGASAFVRTRGCKVLGAVTCFEFFILILTQPAGLASSGGNHVPGGEGCWNSAWL